MTMDDYKKLKEEIESSGMSIRQYCLKHNLKPNAYFFSCNISINYFCFSRLQGDNYERTAR